MRPTHTDPLPEAGFSYLDHITSIIVESATSTIDVMEDAMGEKIDKAKGAANEAVGKAKQAVGKATDSPKTQAKGVAQEAKGTAQKAKGAVKGAVKKS